jgi:site-specific DNA recombinase
VAPVLSCYFADDVDVYRTAITPTQGEPSDAPGRLVTLQREVADCDERPRRLYRSIEDGIIELDDILRERTATLKSECECAKAALDRALAQCGTVTTIDLDKTDAFARLMTEKLDTGDTSAGKTHIHSIVDAIEVDDQAIRIIGSKDLLQAVIAGKQIENGVDRGFVRKWRARKDSNLRPPDS